MISKDKIKSIIERFVEGSDMFLVEIKCSSTNDIEVTIDSDSSVSIDKCAELSKTIEAEFDRDVEDFELMVASAGIGQPIVMLRQYKKIIGKAIEVVLKSGEKVYATLIDADENSITLQHKERVEVDGKKRKQQIDVTKKIDLDELKSARLQIMFK